MFQELLHRFLGRFHLLQEEVQEVATFPLARLSTQPLVEQDLLLVRFLD